MGKYTRKCKGIGELAVMEVSQVAGVRTRARTLAMATATAEAVGVADGGASSKRRKVSGGSGGNGEFQISYLKLRSRSLVLTAEKMKKPATTLAAPDLTPSGSTATANSAAAEWDRMSRCSSNASSSEVVAVETEEGSRSGHARPVEEVEKGPKICEGDWERTPSSELRENEQEEMESIARPTPRRRSRAPAPATIQMPVEAEIDAFFAAEEEKERKRFEQKYNYDVVKDVPLEGRYKWVRVNP